MQSSSLCVVDRLIEAQLSVKHATKSQRLLIKAREWCKAVNMIHPFPHFCIKHRRHRRSPFTRIYSECSNIPRIEFDDCQNPKSILKQKHHPSFYLSCQVAYPQRDFPLLPLIISTSILPCPLHNNFPKFFASATSAFFFSTTESLSPINFRSSELR